MITIQLTSRLKQAKITTVLYDRAGISIKYQWPHSQIYQKFNKMMLKIPSKTPQKNLYLYLSLPTTDLVLH